MQKSISCVSEESNESDIVHEELAKLIDEILLRQTNLNDDDSALLEVFITAIKKRKECCFSRVLPYINNINFINKTSSESPLHHAVREGKVNIVRKILDFEGVDIHILNSNKSTPLHLAALEGYHEVVDLLLAAGADPLLPNKKLNTPLHLAARNNREKCCKSLTQDISIASRQKNKQNNSGDTPLIEAAKNGNISCCSYLVDDNINIQNKLKNTALHCAAQKGYSDTVRFLLSNCNPDYTIKNNLGNTAAHEAASLSCKNTLVELLDHDPDFYMENFFENDKGRTLLHVATNSYDCLTHLLEFNPTIVNKVDSANDTPLHLAIKNKNLECVEKLLEYKVNFKQLNNENKTVLHLAVEKNMPSVCQTILSKNRLIIDMVDDKNVTALHISARLNSANCCRILLKKKPRLDATDGSGRNALHIAASCGDAFICKCLIQAKVPFIAQDDFGDTPLHLAASEGNLECCKLLLKSGKHAIKEQNKRNQTALDVAFENEKDEVFKFLLSSTPTITYNEFKLKIHDFMHMALKQKRR